MVSAAVDHGVSRGSHRSPPSSISGQSLAPEQDLGAQGSPSGMRRQQEMEQHWMEASWQAAELQRREGNSRWFWEAEEQADMHQLFMQSSEATLVAIQNQEAPEWMALMELAASERPFEPSMIMAPDLPLRSDPVVLLNVATTTDIGGIGLLSEASAPLLPTPRQSPSDSSPASTPRYYVGGYRGTDEARTPPLSPSYLLCRRSRKGSQPSPIATFVSETIGLSEEEALHRQETVAEESAKQRRIWKEFQRIRVSLQLQRGAQSLLWPINAPLSMTRNIKLLSSEIIPEHQQTKNSVRVTPRCQTAPETRSQQEWITDSYSAPVPSKFGPGGLFSPIPFQLPPALPSTERPATAPVSTSTAPVQYPRQLGAKRLPRPWRIGGHPVVLHPDTLYGRPDDSTILRTSGAAGGERPDLIVRHASGLLGRPLMAPPVPLWLCSGAN